MPIASIFIAFNQRIITNSLPSIHRGLFIAIALELKHPIVDEYDWHTNCTLSNWWLINNEKTHGLRPLTRGLFFVNSPVRKINMVRKSFLTKRCLTSNKFS